MRFSKLLSVSLLTVLGLAAGVSALPASESRIRIPDAAQPQLAVAGDGRVWLAYAQVAASAGTGSHAPGAGHGKHGMGPRPPGDVLVAQSEDGGATFGPATKLARLPNLMVGNRRGPRIVTFGDRVTVTVIAHELLAFRSVDAGRTWSEPAIINEVPTCAREGLHDLTVGPDGRLFVTWLDLRNDRMELWGAESTDGGRNWGRNAQLYRSPDKSICECCHPTALFDAQGNLGVMWRNSVAGARDMWMMTRAKGAGHFSPPRKLGVGTWPLNACPMDGGRLVSTGDGQFAAVWQRAGEVFFVPATGAEIGLGKGRQPVALMRDGRTTVLWQQGTELLSTSPGAGASPVKRAENARFPVLVSDPHGRGALLAYEEVLPHGSTAVIVQRW